MAVKLIASSEALRIGVGSSSLPLTANRNDETLAVVRAQLEEAAFAEAWTQGQGLTVDEAVALALKS